MMARPFEKEHEIFIVVWYHRHADVLRRTLNKVFASEGGWGFLYEGFSHLAYERSTRFPDAPDEDQVLDIHQFYKKFVRTVTVASVLGNEVKSILVLAMRRWEQEEFPGKVPPRGHQALERRVVSGEPPPLHAR